MQRLGNERTSYYRAYGQMLCQAVRGNANHARCIREPNVLQYMLASCGRDSPD